MHLSHQRNEEIGVLEASNVQGINTNIGIGIGNFKSFNFIK